MPILGLSTYLGTLLRIGKAGIAAYPEVQSLMKAAVSLLHEKDQASAKEAYNDLIADNDAGHARLQAKLAEASK